MHLTSSSRLIFTILTFLTLGIFSFVNSTSGSQDSDKSCTTPSPKSESGFCVPLGSCPSLLSLLKGQMSQENLLFLQSSTSTCDTHASSSSEEPRVCCPSSELPTTTTTTTTTTTPTPTPVSSAKNENKESERTLLQRILRHKNLHLLPDSRECGRSNKADPQRIHGGSDAGLGTYPWMALIGFSDPSGRVQFGCGGTLINSHYVLTAAHCLAELPEGITPTLVRLGEYNKTSEVDCSGGICAPKYQELPIHKIIAHENYDKTAKKENDIGLLRLKTQPKLNPFVHPICLPHGERYQKMKTMKTPIVTGWGRLTADNPDNANVLQEVSVPIKSMDECNQVYSTALGQDVDPGRFCAGGEIGKDSCQGDSGGPLMLGLLAKNVGWKLRFFQYGIVSLGPTNCDSSNYPAIYTKVSHFIPWILDHITP